jgi:hypothetical protein
MRISFCSNYDADRARHGVKPAARANRAFTAPAGDVFAL